MKWRYEYPELEIKKMQVNIICTSDLQDLDEFPGEDGGNL